MDNILFFFPPKTTNNDRMNIVGLCIAVACIVERFSKEGTPKEITFEGRTLTLFSPIENYWLAVDSDSTFSASIVRPLLEQAYEAFVARFGLHTFIQANGQGEAAVEEFFTQFSMFLKNEVLVITPPTVGAQEPAEKAHGSSQSSGDSSPTRTDGVVLHATKGNDGGNEEVFLPQAAADALLGFPLVFSGSLGTGVGYINTIVRQLMSLSTSVATEEASCSNNNDDNEESLSKTAWVSTKFLILHSEELKVLACTIDLSLARSLIFLFTLDPRLSSFVIHCENGRVPRYCCIARCGPVVYFGIVEEELFGICGDLVSSASRRIVENTYDLILTGTCTVLNRGDAYLGLTAPLQPTSPLHENLNNHRKISLNVVSSSSHMEMESSHHVKIHSVCHSNHILKDATLAGFPRVLQWFLSSHMREILQEEEVNENEGKRWCGDVVIREKLLPISRGIWIAVLKSGGRTVGSVFTSCNSLSHALEAQQMLVDAFFMGLL